MQNIQGVVSRNRSRVISLQWCNVGSTQSV